MWADSHPVEYRWHPLLNVVDQIQFTSIHRCQCSNEAKMQNPLKFAGVSQTRQLMSATSGPKFTIIVRICGGDTAV